MNKELNSRQLKSINEAVLSVMKQQVVEEEQPTGDFVLKNIQHFKIYNKFLSKLEGDKEDDKLSSLKMSIEEFMNSYNQDVNDEKQISMVFNKMNIMHRSILIHLLYELILVLNTDDKSDYNRIVSILKKHASSAENSDDVKEAVDTMMDFTAFTQPSNDTQSDTGESMSDEEINDLLAFIRRFGKDLGIGDSENEKIGTIRKFLVRVYDKSSDDKAITIPKNMVSIVTGLIDIFKTVISDPTLRKRVMKNQDSE